MFLTTRRREIGKIPTFIAICRKFFNHKIAHSCKVSTLCSFFRLSFLFTFWLFCNFHLNFHHFRTFEYLRKFAFGPIWESSWEMSFSPKPRCQGPNFELFYFEKKDLQSGYYEETVQAETVVFRKFIFS